jgi:hypothetical protein
LPVPCEGSRMAERRKQQQLPLFLLPSFGPLGKDSKNPSIHTPSNPSLLPLPLRIRLHQRIRADPLHIPPHLFHPIPSLPPPSFPDPRIEDVERRDDVGSDKVEEDDVDGLLLIAGRGGGKGGGDEDGLAGWAEGTVQGVVAELFGGIGTAAGVEGEVAFRSGLGAPATVFATGDGGDRSRGRRGRMRGGGEGAAVGMFEGGGVGGEKEIRFRFIGRNGGGSEGREGGGGGEEVLVLLRSGVLNGEKTVFADEVEVVEEFTGDWEGDRGNVVEVVFCFEGESGERKSVEQGRWAVEANVLKGSMIHWSPRVKAPLKSYARKKRQSETQESEEEQHTSNRTLPVFSTVYGFCFRSGRVMRRGRTLVVRRWKIELGEVAGKRWR